MVIAVMGGWRAPAECRGLTRDNAVTLKLFFQYLGAAVIMVAE